MASIFPLVPLARRQALCVGIMSYDGQHRLRPGRRLRRDGRPRQLRARPRGGDRRNRRHARAAGARRRSGPEAATARSRGNGADPRQRRVPCASRSPRSTPPSATSTATRRRSPSGSDGRASAGADLVVFPELAFPGYPAEDLYLKRHFVEAGSRAVAGARRRGDAGSSPWSASPSRPRAAATYRQAHNSLAVLADGAVAAVYRKIRLPNYGVFDEHRYFEPGDEPAPIEVAGVPGRADDLRGRLGRGPPGLGRGRSRARG